MAQEFTQISDHINALRRRQTPFIVAFSAVLLSAVMLALTLPAAYESEGTILIEGQEIPEEFVQSTVTTFADKQIQVIAQRVMTRRNLEEIVNQFDLYNATDSDLAMSNALAELGESITVEPVRASVVDERTQRTGYVTIAFKVAFYHGDPGTAKQVADRLVELFLTANAQQRTELASKTTEFLGSEAEKLGEEILEIESRMARFKEQNNDSLPELADLNFKQLDRAERDLEQTERDIRTYQERRALLQNELSGITPYASVYGEGGELVSTEDRLTALQRELLTKSSIYSDDHPDIVRLKREISILSNDTGSLPNSASLSAELDAKKIELSDALRRYSSNHPDIVRLKSSIADLESRIAASRNAPPRDSKRRAPDNPRYLQAQAQLNYTNQELEALLSRRNELRRDLDTYKDRLTRTPQTEREWLRLTRDYDITVKKYAEVRAQLDDAYRAETLESESKGERFTLLEPPSFPTQPISPNRPLIFFVGLVFAISISAGIVIFLESMDTTVRNSKDIASILGAPPLATIPILRNKSDDTISLRNRMLITAAAVGAIALVATALL